MWYRTTPKNEPLIHEIGILENFWTTSKIPRSTLDILEKSVRCYEIALTKCSKLGSEEAGSGFQPFVTSLLVDSKDISRSLGNVQNEIGTYFTKMTSKLVNGGTVIWNAAPTGCFFLCIQLFFDFLNNS